MLIIIAKHCELNMSAIGRTNQNMALDIPFIKNHEWSWTNMSEEQAMLLLSFFIAKKKSIKVVQEVTSQTLLVSSYLKYLADCCQALIKY